MNSLFPLLWILIIFFFVSNSKKKKKQQQNRAAEARRTQARNAPIPTSSGSPAPSAVHGATPVKTSPASPPKPAPSAEFIGEGMVSTEGQSMLEGGGSLQEPHTLQGESKEEHSKHVERIEAREHSEVDKEVQACKDLLRRRGHLRSSIVVKEILDTPLSLRGQNW